MGAGRGNDSHGAMAGADHPKSGLLGLTLRQTVVLAVIAYAALTGFFIAKNFKSPKTAVVTDGEHLVVNFRGEKANALTSEEIFEKVPDDDNFNSSLLVESIDDVVPEEYEELRNSLYHSSVVFKLNYDEMKSKFQIFVYPSDEQSFKVLSGGSDMQELRNTDDLLVYQLFHSDFVTMDPEKAHLLLLPVSMRVLLADSEVGPQKAGKFLSKYVQGLRDDYPYWSRTLGADHVLISCNDAKEDGSRNALELKKNAIQVTCSPLAGDGAQSFYPHKDVAMPLYDYTPQPTGDSDGERSTLAYYNGPTDASSFYASLDVSWEDDANFVFESQDVDPAVHSQRLSSSKFCLILGPRDYPNIVNALRFGCVPLLVSDGKLYDLPFQDVLNWTQFTVIVSRKNVAKIKRLAIAFDEKQYITMQYLGREASKHLEWHVPPQEQDAFHMVLYDLWVRRHAIRYVRREEL